MADKTKQKLDALKGLGIEPETVIEDVKEVEASLDEKHVAYKEAEPVVEAAPVVDAEKAKKPDAKPADAKPEDKPAPDKKAVVEPAVEPDDDEGPDAVGNMSLDEFEAMITDCMAKAIAPIMKMMEAKADKPAADDKKKEADERASLKEAVSADIAKAQAEAQASIKAMQAEADAKIAKLNARLKELEGDTPRAFKGYQASEADDNLATEEKVKSAAPTGEPFINQFAGMLVTGKSIS